DRLIVQIGTVDAGTPRGVGIARVVAQHAVFDVVAQVAVDAEPLREHAVARGAVRLVHDSPAGHDGRAVDAEVAHHVLHRLLDGAAQPRDRDVAPRFHADAPGAGAAGGNTVGGGRREGEDSAWG